jgi:hypothetical protein
MRTIELTSAFRRDFKAKGRDRIGATLILSSLELSRFW